MAQWLGGRAISPEVGIEVHSLVHSRRSPEVGLEVGEVGEVDEAAVGGLQSGAGTLGRWRGWGD